MARQTLGEKLLASLDAKIAELQAARAIVADELTAHKAERRVKATRAAKVRRPSDTPGVPGSTM